MIPTRGKLVFAALLFGMAVAFAASAQDAPSQEQPDGEQGSGPALGSDWEGVRDAMYVKGDKSFIISLGTVFPLVFIDDQGQKLDNNLNVGGTGILNYNYYFTPNIAVGGELGGMFASTIGENMLYIVPFGAKATYQFLKGSFEIPLSLTLGFAAEQYLDTGYFGFFAKPQAALFWRYNQDWSFGLNAALWLLPQWGTSNDSYGFFQEITLAARYHF